MRRTYRTLSLEKLSHTLSGETLHNTLPLRMSCLSLPPRIGRDGLFQMTIKMEATLIRNTKTLIRNRLEKYKYQRLSDEPL